MTTSKATDFFTPCNQDSQLIMSSELVKVTNDHRASDKGTMSILFLLVLSAAFDALDITLSYYEWKNSWV